MDHPDYNYLENLNPQQREAVEYLDGPQLVIAGAGSGKTRVLTHKLVHLIRCGIPPERIMALTFTNKAAREMQSRIDKMLEGKSAWKVWSGTFHSIFLRILRKNSELIGFRPNFTIYDASDSKSLLKTIIKEMELDDKTYKVSSIASAISNAKNSLVTWDQYLNNSDFKENDKRAKRPLTGEIYKRYAERCRIAQSMDFDDILLYTNILFRDNEDIRKQYAEWFRYILVDEYQDTNFAQHLIVSMLSSRYNALCVVGDDAQSIYSFRGANINNILTLEKRFPGLKTFKLERNYRSTQNIVDAADSLIAKNTRQIKKNVFSENEKGERIKIIKTYSDLEEAVLVASMIAQSRNMHHDSLEDYAVLFRTNAQSRTLEEALRKKNIAYRIYGGLSFYQRKEIKDAIAYFRLAVNPDDDEALRRVINFPARGIGDTTMKKLQKAASDNGVSLFHTLQNLESLNVPVNSGTKKKLEAFGSMIKEFAEDNKTSNAYELAQLIYNRSGILTAYSDEKTPEEISKKENIMELLSGLKEFIDSRVRTGETDMSMSSFLNEVSLATDQDQADSDSQYKVTLMTAHAAKGLEFKHVYIVGVEEELFPSALSMNSLSEVEEERRLLYVAMTRAMLTCTITYSGTRFRNGQTVLTRPSRFLHEIDRKNVDMQSSVELSFTSREKFTNPASNYLREKSKIARIKKSNHDYTDVREIEETSDGKLRKGVRISHDVFGIGEVRKIENLSGDEIIIVDFEKVGIKKLMLKYAKFKFV